MGQSESEGKRTGGSRKDGVANGAGGPKAEEQGSAGGEEKACADRPADLSGGQEGGTRADGRQGEVDEDHAVFGRLDLADLVPPEGFDDRVHQGSATTQQVGLGPEEGRGGGEGRAQETASTDPQASVAQKKKARQGSDCGERVRRTMAVNRPDGAVGGAIEGGGQREPSGETEAGSDSALARTVQVRQGLGADKEGGERDPFGMDPDRKGGKDAGAHLTGGAAAQQEASGEDRRENDEEMMVRAVERGVAEGGQVQEQHRRGCRSGGQADGRTQRPQERERQEDGGEALNEAGADKEGLAGLKAKETERPGGGEEKPGGGTRPLQRDAVRNAITRAPVEGMPVEEMAFEDDDP